MDSLTRFHFLLTRQSEKLDRIPIDYWASKEIDSRLCRVYHCSTKNELLDKLDVDFRYIQGPKYIGPPLSIHSDGSEDDLWGVPRRRVYFGEGEFRGSYENVTKSPLEEIQSVNDVENYAHWPDPDWYDYSEIAAQCDSVHEQRRVAMFMGDRLNRFAQLKPMMYIRGVEQTLADLARKNAPIFDAILVKIREFYGEYLKRILKEAKGKIDVIVSGDDFGQQDGLICSPRSWRSKILPGFQEYIQLAKNAGTATMHHTCGSVVPIIDDMIEAGLDILNPIQPQTAGMDPELLKANWGDRIIFHGGISLQRALRFGSPSEVKTEVAQTCKILGSRGGFIICTAHNLNADLQTSNIQALFEAYQEYCPYIH